MGSASPSSMYLGAPPYGTSLYSRPAIPPYDLPPPYGGGSAYPYEYGRRLSVGSPYGPMHIPGPPPYSGGSMMGTGWCSFSLELPLLFTRKNLDVPAILFVYSLISMLKVASLQPILSY